MTSPIYYMDRIVIKRVKSRYLKNVPYEYEYSFNDDDYQEIFGCGYKGTLLSGQLFDGNFHRNPGDCRRKLKIIAKTANGNVESNTLVLPNERKHQKFAFEIITKGNKQIYLTEVPFQEEIIPLSRVADVDKKGIIYIDGSGEKKKILFSEAYKEWKECMVSKGSRPKYIANCSESYPCELRFFTKNRENISFFNENEDFERWKLLVKKISKFGYDIFDEGSADLEGNAKYNKEKILGREIEPPRVPKSIEEWMKRHENDESIY